MHQNRTDCKGQASHDACPLAMVRDVFHFSGARFPAAFSASGGCLSFHSERKIHRRVSRFPATLWHENRDTSSKPPRFIRRRRRFIGFRQKPMVSGLPFPSRALLVMGLQGNRLSNRPAAAPTQVKKMVRLPLRSTDSHDRTANFFN